MLDFLGDLRRTHTCGALRPSDAGQKAVLMGWVNRRRDLGNLIFIDLRDRTGITQVVINKELSAAAHDRAEVGIEYELAFIFNRLGRPLPPPDPLTPRAAGATSAARPMPQPARPETAASSVRPAAAPTRPPT